MRRPNSSPASTVLIRSLFAGSLLLAAASAQAGPVTFNAAGTGNAGPTAQVATFDELPGNALAQGAQVLINAAASKPAGTVTTTSPFTLYYQANVRLIDTNGNTVNTGNNVITAVAKFNETATVTAGSNTVVFNLAPDQTGSYLDFFAHPPGSMGSNPAGTGFSNDLGGVLIYSSTPGTSGPSGNFTNTGGQANLDSTNANTPANTGQQTVTGFGGSRITFFTSYVNTNYFVSNPGPSTTFNTNNNLPFTDVPPSALFENLTGAGAGSTFTNYVTPMLGSLNGASGPDTQFQADASNSFNTVPEPASVVMTLLGLGGVGFVGYAKRRRAAQA